MGKCKTWEGEGDSQCRQNPEDWRLEITSPNSSWRTPKAPLGLNRTCDLAGGLSLLLRAWTTWRITRGKLVMAGHDLLGDPYWSPPPGDGTASTVTGPAETLSKTSHARDVRSGPDMT